MVVKVDKRSFWEEKVKEAKLYNGPDTKFCREQGINNITFKYWKSRLSKNGSMKSKSRIHSEILNPFVEAKVQFEPPIVGQDLDSKWVAEFFNHFLRGSR